MTKRREKYSEAFKERAEERGEWANASTEGMYGKRELMKKGIGRLSLLLNNTKRFGGKRSKRKRMPIVSKRIKRTIARGGIATILEKCDN